MDPSILWMYQECWGVREGGCTPYLPWGALRNQDGSSESLAGEGVKQGFERLRKVEFLVSEPQLGGDDDTIGYFYSLLLLAPGVHSFARLVLRPGYFSSIPARLVPPTFSPTSRPF